MTIDEAREQLRTQKGSMRAAEVVQILSYFAFTVKAGRRGRHHVVTHPELAKYGFTSWSFNGKDPVPNSYLTQLRTLLDTYREGLEEIGYE